MCPHIPIATTTTVSHLNNPCVLQSFNMTNWPPIVHWYSSFENCSVIYTFFAFFVVVLHESNDVNLTVATARLSTQMTRSWPPHTGCKVQHLRCPHRSLLLPSYSRVFSFAHILWGFTIPLFFSLSWKCIFW